MAANMTPEELAELRRTVPPLIRYWLWGDELSPEERAALAMRGHQIPARPRGPGRAVRGRGRGRGRDLPVPAGGRIRVALAPLPPRPVPAVRQPRPTSVRPPAPILPRPSPSSSSGSGHRPSGGPLDPCYDCVHEAFLATSSGGSGQAELILRSCSHNVVYSPAPLSMSFDNLLPASVSSTLNLPFLQASFSDSDMPRVPRYLEKVNAMEGGSADKGKKRAAPDPVDPKSAQSKKSHVESPVVPPTADSGVTIPEVGPSSAGFTLPVAGPSSTGPSSGAPPSPEPSAATALPSPLRIDRGKLWDDGSAPEIAAALLPPKHFVGGEPLPAADTELIRELRHAGLRLAGLSQSFLLLQKKYVFSCANLTKSRTAHHSAVQEITALRAENARLREEDAKLREDQAVMQGALTKAESEVALLAKTRDLAVSEVEVIRAERDAARAERDESAVALLDSKAEAQELAALLKETAEEAFESALEQLRHLNPSVTLNTEGYHFRSYFEDDGQFNAYAPEAEEGPTSAPGGDGGAAGEQPNLE